MDPTRPILTDAGVDFGKKIGFVPWVAGTEYPKILVPRLIGYNILSEWDVRLWVEYGVRPAADSGKIAAPFHPESDLLGVYPRRMLDFAERHAAGRGRALRLPMDKATALRDDVGRGRLTVASAADNLGVGRTLAFEILAGRAYWWAGGGSPSWEGFR